MLDRDGPLKCICPSLRCSPPPTASLSQLGTSRGAQATSPILQLLKVRDTSGFLPSELLQFAGFLHARRDAQGFLPTSVFPALAFTASLCHVSMHKDAVSSPLLRPGSCPSLKDTYFHIQVVQRHRKFLRFAFGGKGYQYKVLPFWLALAPRMFTKCMDAALAPMRLQGIQILNYLDNWLFLGSSREQVIQSQGLSSCSLFSSIFLGVCLDSTLMQARLAPARVESIRSCTARFKLGWHVSVGLCRRLLGLMVAASPVLPLVLLHMIPFLWYEVPGYSSLLAVPSPSKSIRRLFLRPFSVAGP